jgi:hypothetical protein
MGQRERNESGQSIKPLSKYLAEGSRRPKVDGRLVKLRGFVIEQLDEYIETIESGEADIPDTDGPIQVVEDFDLYVRTVLKSVVVRMKLQDLKVVRDSSPNMVCFRCHREFMWTRWDTDDVLPKCPYDHQALDWIGT